MVCFYEEEFHFVMLPYNSIYIVLVLSIIQKYPGLVFLKCLSKKPGQIFVYVTHLRVLFFILRCGFYVYFKYGVRLKVQS